MRSEREIRSFLRDLRTCQARPKCDCIVCAMAGMVQRAHRTQLIATLEWMLDGNAEMENVVEAIAKEASGS